MVGKPSHVSPLDSRKQLLIAESEINRAQLSREWQSIAHGVRGLAHRAKTVGAWASSAALLAAGIGALRRGPSTPGVVKDSWFQKILIGVRAASAIWFSFRARGDKEDHIR